MKSRAEISETENRKTIEKVNTAKVLFHEMINKTDKLLPGKNKTLRKPIEKALWEWSWH